jgi:predicted nucleic acid-binding protein
VLNTTIFIYQVQAHLRYLSLADYAFSWMQESSSRAITSTITMTELLVQPYRNLDDQWVDEFYALLSSYPNLDWIAPSLEIADGAARIREWNGLRTPDALQAATAVAAEATGLLTNDPVFERVADFETLVLDHAL